MEQVGSWGFWFFATLVTKDPTMNIVQPQQDKLLRVVPHIVDRMGISRSGWWQGVKDGKYPPGIKLSPRVTVWRESEVNALIANLGK